MLGRPIIAIAAGSGTSCKISIKLIHESRLSTATKASLSLAFRHCHDGGSRSSQFRSGDVRLSSNTAHQINECVECSLARSTRPNIVSVNIRGTKHYLYRRYGHHQDQFGHLHVSKADPELGVVVLFHGGFWRQHRSLLMTSPLAHALAVEGWNVWNVEYRRGRARWRETLADCATAADHVVALAEELALSTRTVLLVGHSSGGHLAAWVASRSGQGVGVEASGLVTLNSLLDLTGAAATGTGNGAVVEFLGGSPVESPTGYLMADPSYRVPLGLASRCLHSTKDERVPIQATKNFTTAARAAGDDASLVPIDGHHTAPLNIGSTAHEFFLREIADFAARAGASAATEEHMP